MLALRRALHLLVVGELLVRCRELIHAHWRAQLAVLRQYAVLARACADLVEHRVQPLRARVALVQRQPREAGHGLDRAPAHDAQRKRQQFWLGERVRAHVERGLTAVERPWQHSFVLLEHEVR